MSSDLDALSELERRPLGLPQGLDLEWLGVAGYRLTYEGVTILVDPYVSRVPLRSLLLRRPALPATSRGARPPSSSATRTGITPWTRRRSPVATAARSTARIRSLR